MTVHPRQQSPVSQTVPVVFAQFLLAECFYYLLQRRCRIARQQWYLRVNLIGRSDNSHLGLRVFILGEIGTDTIHIALGMRLKIEEEAVVRIGQQELVLLLVAQQRDCHTVDIVTQISSHIFIRIGGLHGIDSSHETCMLVDRIAVHDNVADDGAELLVAARLQPTADTAVV